MASTNILRRLALKASPVPSRTFHSSARACPSCSESHIPGYINHQKLKSAGSVFVVAVNDPFVTKAWGATLDPTGSSGIRFLGDPTAKFTEALDLTFDGTAIFGGPRSKRYALEVSDGKVVKIHVEPDNTGLDALPKVDNISSHLKKRKAAEELVPSGQSAQRSSKRLDSAASKEAPPTPLTTATPMSSEDDFMSGMSSDEDDVLQESENEEGSADDFGFDEPEPDLGFSQKEDVQKKKKIFDVNFKVYQPKDIQAQQDDLIDEVNMILDIRKEDAAILLRHFRWNKERLIEDYMDRPKRVLEAAGLGTNVAGPPKLEVIPGFCCDICCEDEPGLKSFAMKCGHRFCVTCYNQYLAQKIKEEGEAARIQCPAEGCKRIIDAKSLDLLVTADLQQRYHELLTRTYVEDKEHLKWCPAPDCQNAIECGIKKKDLDRVVPTVVCDCKHRFCFGCILSDHQPAPCELVKRFEEKSGSEARDAQAKSRVSLERYLHYYNRYANHEQSAKLDKDIYNKTERKMTQLQSASGMSWIEVQYLNSASQALQTCRQTLKWTYAFAFYLARNNLTEMFEDNQKDLEMAVEALSEMFEKNVQELAEPKLKVEIMDKTSYCNKRRVILLADTADNLANGVWSWGIDF
ncbi:putative protein ariadne-1 [Glarea lozoyensis 74030]|uniref:RBR-type E3 ubiquitin transferase n=1 Tax=Glarea lozoyensis (strain ATCC 74030 / MF5533) TaxID=1104152 RepID=H0EL25_GLAL7|nr:putative protein ariadne-1 [Glarea lozoyensis 74030]